MSPAAGGGGRHLRKHRCRRIDPTLFVPHFLSLRRPPRRRARRRRTTLRTPMCCARSWLSRCVYKGEGGGRITLFPSQDFMRVPLAVMPQPAKLSTSLPADALHPPSPPVPLPLLPSPSLPLPPLLPGSVPAAQV